MFKKSLLILFVFSLSLTLTAQSKNNDNIIKFLKGNISDKTAAVREASGDEAYWITNKAIDFSLENKKILGNDRDLDALAVAAILSISSEYIKNASDNQKATLSTQLNQLYTEFQESNTVEIALLTKIASIKDLLPIDNIVTSINTKFKTDGFASIDSALLKTTLVSLEKIGNTESFIILYYFYTSNKYPEYDAEIKNTLIALSPNAMNEISGFIKDADTAQLKRIYELTKKTDNFSTNNQCIIAENILNRSILLMGSSSRISPEDIDMQVSTLKVLAANKWTRASATALSYFQFAKNLYQSENMKDQDFTSVINSLSSISPVTAVNPLTAYLEELNGQKEEGKTVSSPIILAVINTLGAIGDKAAFDSLLAVTYLNYEESVLSAAREALSGLRWQ